MAILDKSQMHGIVVARNYIQKIPFKIGFEKDSVEFTVKEQHSQNSDCKQATKFLTEYLK